MRSITQKLFGASRRARLLAVAFLFVVANMVSTFGVFVPSASAALVWEDIVVADGPNGTTRTSGAVPKGSGLDLFTLSSADLSAYSSFKLSFDYENSNQSITSLNLFYWLYESHIAGDSIGSAINFSPSESVSASSGHIEATFSGSVPSTNRLRLMIDDVNRNISNDPSDRLDITNIRFQGQKDDGMVAAPAAPTLTAPADGALVSYDDIQNGITKLQFTSETGVAKNHVVLSGIYYNQVQNNETPFEYEITTGTYGASGNIALNNLASKNSASYDFIVGKTYTWKVRSSFSDIAYNAAEGWGAWSTRTFTVTAGDEVVVPTAPVLVSPTDSATVHYDDIQDGTATLAFTPDAGVQKNHLVITGTFDETNPGHESNVSSAVSTVELNKFAKQGGLIDFIPGNTYTWKVRSSFTNAELQGEEQQWGVWSQSRTFTVVGDNTVPSAPTLISPADNVEIKYGDIQSFDLSVNPKLQFTKQAGVALTQIELSGDFRGNSGDIVEEVSIYYPTTLDYGYLGNFAHSSPEATYDYIIGNTYTWRVRASFSADTEWDASEGWGAWSVLRSFTVVDGSSVPVFDVPTLISPDDNAATSNAAPTFTWGAVEGAGMYRLVVRPDALSSTFWECYTTSTSCSSLVPQNTTDTTLLPGRYYWYVEAHPSANPHADDPDGMHWVSSLDRAITITAGGDGNSGSGNTTTVSTGASPSPAGNTPAPNTPAPVDTTGEVLNEQDTAPSTAADEDQASERSNEATTSSDESNEDEDSKPFLLLGWWWAVIVAAGAAGSYGYIKSQKD